MESTSSVQEQQQQQQQYIASNEYLTPNRERQSVLVSDETVRGGEKVWRNARYPHALVNRLTDDNRTTYEGFKLAVQKYGDRPCLGKRSSSIKTSTADADATTSTAGDYEWSTFDQVYTRACNAAAGFVHLGIKPREHLGIWSKNRIEWQVVAQGVATQSMVTISLYDTLGEESSEYIVNHAELVAVCCSSETLPKLLKIIPKCPSVKFIVCFDEVKSETTTNSTIPIYTLTHVEELGAQHPVSNDVPPEPSDLYTIMYTSGTTGMPKGVMITHSNMTSMIAAAQVHVVTKILQAPGDHAVIGFLPLAHIFGRLVEDLCLQNGVRVGYWQGDVTKLADDMKALKPTIMATVPRVLDRVYDKVKSGVEAASWLNKYIFSKAYARKKAALESGSTTPLCDWLVFDKIKANMGGAMQLIISSGAPLRPEVQEFMSVVFGAPVVQAYGLTEISGAGFVQLADDFSFAHVGSVVPCNEVKLESVPEMNYLNTNDPPSGEVCYRGGSVSMGYFKDEEKTREVFDEDGWFHSGDIAKMLPNGTLVIVDRIKNIFKLSQGEYIAAESIENKLGQNKLLSRLWVYGDSFKSCLVGVGVVNTPVFVQFAKNNGFPDASADNIKELIQDKKLNSLVLKELADTGKANKLHGFELVRAIHLVDYDFDAIGCVTPTLKLQRAQLKNYYQKEIDEMYAGMAQ